MYKNQLQELAQRSCFNLPAYASVRAGPDHAPRFKACVNFNGETFQSPGYSPTLRQAEHSAAEVALNLLSSTGSKSLTARVLDETGVYKTLLQETAHKAGLNLPVYTTIRSGPGHVPIFTCTVELAGLSFTGDSAKTKKQAEKNAAISAWSSLKKMPSLVTKKESSSENNNNDEQEEEIVRRVLSNFRPQKSTKQNNNHPRRSRYYYRNSKPDNYPFNYNNINYKPRNKPLETSFVELLPPPPPRTTSKILPLTFKTNVVFQEGQNGKLSDPILNKANTDTALQEVGQTYIRNLFIAPLGCSQRGNLVNYAPAVQIRSIIPVCASPPAKSPSFLPVKPVLPSNEPTSLPFKLTSENSVPSLTNRLNSDLSKFEVKD